MRIPCLTLVFLVAFINYANSDSLSQPSVELGIEPGRPEYDLFEGDMMLTSEQREALKAAVLDGDSGQDYNDYNAVINPDMRWPGGVVKYQIHDWVTAYEAELIRNTLNNLTQTLDSCLTFVESSSGNRILVMNNGGRCESWVGYHGWPTQTLHLDSSHCMKPGIIEHEFLHAIGIHHTQSRSDRDDYIKIIEENIQPGEEHNFNKYDNNTVSHYGLPYDYESLMHYFSTAWGIGDPPAMTIQTLDPSKQNVIGQSKGVSQGDIDLIKLMYECKPTTDKPTTITAKPAKCKDDVDSYCSWYISIGHWYCTTGDTNNDDWMKENCYKSCVGCPGGSDHCAYTDKDERCQYYANQGYCSWGYVDFMEANCQKSCYCNTAH